MRSPTPPPLSPTKTNDKVSLIVSDTPIAGWKRGQRAVRAPRAPRVIQRELSKCVQKYEGHKDWILKLGLTSDGKKLVAASQDTDARVFDVSSGKCLKSLTSHGASVLSVALCEENNTMFTASLDGTVKQWNLHTGDLLLSAKCHVKGILSLTVVDTVSFVTGSRDDTAAKWEIRDPSDVEDDPLDDMLDPFEVFGDAKEQGSSGKVVKRAVTYEGHSRWIMATCVDSNKLFTGSTDTTVRRWDLISGKEEFIYTGHSQEVTSVAVSGSYLYTGNPNPNPNPDPNPNCLLSLYRIARGDSEKDGHQYGRDAPYLHGSFECRQRHIHLESKALHGLG